MKKKPQELNTKLTHELLKRNTMWGDATSEQGDMGEIPFFVNNEFGTLHDAALPFKHLVQQVDSPLSISDYRLGIVLQGVGHAIVNLREQRLEKGTIIMVGPGTIIQLLWLSQDMRVKGIALFRDFPMPFSSERKLPIFNAVQPFVILHPNNEDFAIACHLFETIWDIVNIRYDSDVVSGLVAAVFSHWNHIYISQTEHEQKVSNRSQEIFDSFIQLVNRHAVQEHHISFYADRLCLSERYLGTVVHQVSGVTAKEWIDRALITEIKVRLRHSNLSLKQIADIMHFPNTSFFSQYFKRLTKMTPGEYREGEN